MEIIYRNRTVEKHFNPKFEKSWRYPSKVREKLLAVNNFLEAAISLNDVCYFPPYRFHQLKGDRKGEWSIYLGNTGWRVTVIPCDENKNPILSGDILNRCKYIKIVMVTEVSNHYE